MPKQPDLPSRSKTSGRGGVGPQAIQLSLSVDVLHLPVR